MARSASFIAPPCLLHEECGRVSWSKGYCLMHYKRVWRGGQADRTQKVSNGKSLDHNLRFHGWTVTPAGCWEWNGAVDLNGYGIVYSGGESLRAHRASFTAWTRPLVEGEMVLHSCDNRPCINPAHLRAGNQIDNSRDMVERGRQNAESRSGEKNWKAKLTDSEVREIRSLLPAPLGGQKLLADRFEVSQACISQIKLLKTRRAA